MGTSFVAPDNPYAKDSAYWSSYNATAQANQANLLHPGSSPYGWYAAPTVGGVYQGKDANGQPVATPNYGTPGTFNAVGYGPQPQAPPAPGVSPAVSTPRIPLAGGRNGTSIIPGANPRVFNPNPPSTGPGGTPAGDATWTPDGTEIPSGAPNTGLVPQSLGTSTTGRNGIPTPTPTTPYNPNANFGEQSILAHLPTGQTVAGTTPTPTTGGTSSGGKTAIGSTGYTPPTLSGDQNNGLPAGYFMSNSPGQSAPVAAPTFQTYMGQRLEAFNSPFITPGAFAADIVGQLGSYASDTPYAQFARDYAGNHPDDPEIAARGGIEGFIAYYNQPQFSLSAIRPDLANVANGWGSGVAGSYKGLGDAGTKLLWSPGQQPAFDAAPDQVKQALLMNGVTPNSPTWNQALSTANSNLGMNNGAHSFGASPVAFSTDPSHVNDMGQLIYQPGATGSAGTPGLGTGTSGGVTPNAGYGSGPNIGTGGNSIPQLLASQYFGTPVSPDQQLAFNSGNLGYLQQIVANGGNPTAVAPAWLSAIQAMQKNTKRQAADLSEQFGVSGNRFSQAFGTSMTDYYNQSNLNQNALLAQMLQSSLESAAGRQLTGAQTLGGFAQSGLQQLSSQGFQASQNAQAQRLQAALAMLSSGGSAASQLAGQGASGANTLLQNAVLGAQGLYGTENQAMFAEIARQLQLQQMGLGAANNLSNLWQQNLGLGANLGGQQNQLNQTQLNNLYQEWMRQQPQYNPLLSMFNSGANTYPQLFQQQFSPSQLAAILAGAGGLAGAAPGLINIFKNLFQPSSGSSSGGINLGDIFGGSGGADWFGSGNTPGLGIPGFLNF